MNNQSVTRDERTLSVENSSYRWAYLLLSFGLLGIVAYRGLLWRESNWDLLGLVILGGLVTTFYQGAHRILSRRWAWFLFKSTRITRIPIRIQLTKVKLAKNESDNSSKKMMRPYLACERVRWWRLKTVVRR